MRAHINVHCNGLSPIFFKITHEVTGCYTTTEAAYCLQPVHSGCKSVESTVNLINCVYLFLFSIFFPPTHTFMLLDYLYMTGWCSQDNSYLFRYLTLLCLLGIRLSCVTHIHSFNRTPQWLCLHTCDYVLDIAHFVLVLGTEIILVHMQGDEDHIHYNIFPRQECVQSLRLIN